MISKQQQKYIQSLHLKKNRITENTFLVEGRKSILELANSNFEIVNIYVSADLIEEFKKLFVSIDVIEATADEINKVSSLSTNRNAIAVVKIPFVKKMPDEPEDLILALDSINDPGNLGTIIRIADWYGIKHIICSENTVDFFNPKVIVASMGSFVRVQVNYLNLTEFLANTKLPILGAFLGGENVHDFQFPKASCLVIGSESHGISEEVSKLINKKITIPRFGYAESLNAGVATAIILDDYKRIHSN